MANDSTAPPTRIGFVGINDRARRLLLRGLAASPRARVTALCSREAAKARQVASELGGAHVFSNVAAMASSGEVDAVFVNTPVDAHVDGCMAAIAARCAVICEKPLAPTTRAGAALQRAAAAAGVRTVVNFTYRSGLGYRLTERLLAAVDLGRPLHAEFALLQGHNFLPGFPPASALVDSGVHLFDTLRGLGAAAGLGSVTRVCAAPMASMAPPASTALPAAPAAAAPPAPPGPAPGLARTRLPAAAAPAAPMAPPTPTALPAAPAPADHGWAFIAHTSRNVTIAAWFSRSALGWQNGLRWSLYGDAAALIVEQDGDRTTARMARRGEGRPQGTWHVVPVPPDLAADDARFPEFHLDRLVGAVRGAVPFPDFADAVAAQRLADALAESAATGKWAEVEREDPETGMGGGGANRMEAGAPMSVPRVRFGHVAFRVADLDRSIRWYEAAFGGREAFRANREDGSPQLVYVEIAPGQFVELFPGGRNPIELPADPIGYAHTCLLVDDLPAVLAHLAGMGVVPANPPRAGRAGQTLAFISDPDGNRIELMQVPPGSPLHRASQL